MPEQSTASDLEKAHLILSEFGLLIGPAEKSAMSLPAPSRQASRLGERKRWPGSAAAIGLLKPVS